MSELGLDAAGALRPPPPTTPSWPAGTPTAHLPARWGRPSPRACGHALRPRCFPCPGSRRQGSRDRDPPADRRTAVFTVDAVEVYDKESFPDQKVYGPSGRPELRVITCGGGYTEKAGYRSNVVVFATLTAVRQPAGFSPLP
ncbi:hypothetical protein NKH18_03290 [Streptomyces sp. M10(2022)]